MSNFAQVLRSQRAIRKLADEDLSYAVASCRRRGVRRRFYRTVCDLFLSGELHEVLDVLATELHNSGAMREIDDDIYDVLLARENLLQAAVVKKAALELDALHKAHIADWGRHERAEASHAPIAPEVQSSVGLEPAPTAETVQ